MITSCLLISIQEIFCGAIAQKKLKFKKDFRDIAKIKNIERIGWCRSFLCTEKMKKSSELDWNIGRTSNETFKDIFAIPNKRKQSNFPCCPGVNISFKKAVFTLLVLKLKLFMTTSAAKEAIVNISDIFLTLSNGCIELQNHKTTKIIQVIFMYIICHVLARPRANYDIRHSICKVSQLSLARNLR